VSGDLSALARLAALRRQEADLRAQLSDLEAARRARGAEALATDLALRAGADLRWEVWVDRRAGALTAELARLLARVEAARDALRASFGRRLATEALADRARAERAARRARAEDRGG